MKNKKQVEIKQKIAVLMSIYKQTKIKELIKAIKSIENQMPYKEDKHKETNEKCKKY